MEIGIFRNLWPGSKEDRDLPPAEVERLIVTNASEASLLRYQEVIGKRVATEAADYVDRHAQGYARHVEDVSYPDSGTVDALGEVADIIRKSRFPAQLISLRKASDGPVG